MKKLTDREWKNVFNNLKEDKFEIEVTWLDEVGGPGEWCLNVEDELLEDGFESEKEAQKRLEELEQRFL